MMMTEQGAPCGPTGRAEETPTVSSSSLASTGNDAAAFFADAPAVPAETHVSSPSESTTATPTEASASEEPVASAMTAATDEKKITKAAAPAAEDAPAAPATATDPDVDESRRAQQKADEDRKRALAERDASASNVTSFIVSEEPPRRPAAGMADAPKPKPENAVEDEDIVEAPPDSELCDDLCAPWLDSHPDVDDAIAPPLDSGLVDLRPEAPWTRTEMVGPASCCMLGAVDMARGVVDGRWGMSLEAHGDEAQTSFFEYRRKLGPVVVAADASLSAVAAALSGQYLGHFLLQVPGKAAPQKVDDKTMQLDFAPDTEGRFNVRGEGRNRYGPFRIVGSTDSDGANLEVYRVYLPKHLPQPKAQRLPKQATPGRRGGGGGGGSFSSGSASAAAATTPGGAPPVRKPSGKDLVRVQQALITSAANKNGPGPSAQRGAGTTSKKRKAAVTTPAPLPRSDSVASAASSSYPATTTMSSSGRVRKAPSHLRAVSPGSGGSHNQHHHMNPQSARAGPGHLSEKMRRCYQITVALEKASGSHWFLAPVDPIALGVPHYVAVVPEPMDLGTLKKKVECGAYADVAAYASDARRIFRNAMTFNVLPASPPHVAARDVLDRLELELAALEREPSPPPRSSSKKDASASAKRDADDLGDDLSNAGGGPSAKKRKGQGKGGAGKSAKKGPGQRGGGGQAADNSSLRTSSDMVPVTHLVDMQRQMETMQATILQLQRQAQMTDIQVQMNMELGLGPAGGPAPAAQAPSAKAAKNSKPLSFDEKAQLSDDINALPADKLMHVIKIVQEHMPLVNNRSSSADDEIEVDIETLDNETLRHLQRYVKQSLGPAAKKPRAQPQHKKPRASPIPAAASHAEAAAYPSLGAGFKDDDDDDDDDLAFDVLGGGI